MPSRILILGGYGNFGSYISRRLAPDPAFSLLIAGRSREKAGAFAAGLPAAHPPEALAIDVAADLGPALEAAGPDIVIHTVGPFQGQDYRVAEACIACGAHYLDLADARTFVAGISRLDDRARQAGVVALSGASSVPCLTASIVDHFRGRFARLHSLDYGISAAQQTNRGVATAAAVLSYAGKPFAALRDGRPAVVYGWQDLHAETYPELGRRLFANCDVPDLELFPARYPELKSIRFCAGHEISWLNLGTWLLAGLVRMRLLPSLDRWAAPLLRASFLFDRAGTGRSGLHLFLAGTAPGGRRRTVRYYLIARQGHGPNIPCAPAILLARRLVQGPAIDAGARPCLDLIGLDEYLEVLAGLDLSVVVEEEDA